MRRDFLVFSFWVSIQPDSNGTQMTQMRADFRRCFEIVLRSFQRFSAGSSKIKKKSALIHQICVICVPYRVSLYSYVEATVQR